MSTMLCTPGNYKNLFIIVYIISTHKFLKFKSLSLLSTTTTIEAESVPASFLAVKVKVPS